jgi:uncharacterized paraquat-inducible protein A
MVDFVIKNWASIVELIVAIIGLASLIVKITPTLKDDSFLLPIIKFIGKWIALDKYSPEKVDRPK